MNKDRAKSAMMRLDRRHCLLGAAALSANAGLLSRPSLAANGKNITVAQIYELTAFDPYASPNDFPVWKHMMEPLITFDFTAKRYVGVLASAWQVVDGDWIFELRDGIKFHDGSPFNAADVKFSLDRALASKIGFILRPVASVEILDPRRVKVRTKAPFANLLARLKHIVIQSSAAHQRLGEEAFSKAAIGTGPYSFVEWKRGVRVTARRAASYWGSPADVAQITWEAIPDQAARTTALEAGSATVIASAPTQEADRIRTMRGLHIEEMENLASFHIGLTQRFEPFRNPSVRRAMNLAIDADSIVKDVLDGHATRAIGVSGRTAIGYNPDLKPHPYDPAKAKLLLSEAGYPNGFSVDLYASSGRDPAIAQTVVSQLAKIGVTANLKLQEPSVYWDGMSTGKWPMVIFSGFNEEDPELFLSLYFETGVTKRLEYSTPWFDDAVKALRVTFDPEKQDQLAREINARIYNELMPTVPLYHPKGLYGVSDRLEWKPLPNEEMYFHRARLK